jgi:hypothetical protein
MSRDVSEKEPLLQSHPITSYSNLSADSRLPFDSQTSASSEPNRHASSKLDDPNLEKSYAPAATTAESVLPNRDIDIDLDRIMAHTISLLQRSAKDASDHHTKISTQSRINARHNSSSESKSEPPLFSSGAGHVRIVGGIAMRCLPTTRWEGIWELLMMGAVAFVLTTVWMDQWKMRMWSFAVAIVVRTGP